LVATWEGDSPSVRKNASQVKTDMTVKETVALALATAADRVPTPIVAHVSCNVRDGLGN